MNPIFPQAHSNRRKFVAPTLGVAFFGVFSAPVCAQIASSQPISVPSQSGSLQVIGTVIKAFPDQSEVVMKVTRIVPYGGQPIPLNPPRVKLLIFRDGEIPDALAAGASFTAEGKDAGRGKPLRVARVTIDGISAPVSDSGDSAESTDTPRDAGAGMGGNSSDQVPASSVTAASGGVAPAVPPPAQAPARRTPAKMVAPPLAARRRAVEKPPKAFVLLSDGTRVEGSRLLTLEATGYGPEDNGEWGDQTFLGTTVGFGTVAVDPRVIPLGKHLWVEGYGFCIALDIGGAIKGKRIDLGQDNEDDAQAVGRQKRRVLVLD